MPDKNDLADNVEEQLDDVIYRIEDTLKDVAGIVRPLPEHVNNMLSRIAHLELLQAAKEIPLAVGEAAEGAGKVVGDAGETAAAGIETVPAAATDIIEDVQPVGGDVSKGSTQAWRQFKLKKRR